jgi:NADH dehydrogenase (ubiquinone) 1 beta subcomplex subunit 5
MNIVPTRWYDLQFREILAFYTFIVAGPLIAISTYCNIFIGRAKLKPIPEGYEPKEEEYERHPITRWFMRNFYYDGQMLYEVKLHAIWEQWNTTHRSRLIKEVKRVMNAEGDYAGWSYSPSDAKYARMAKNEWEERKEYAGDFR